MKPFMLHHKFGWLPNKLEYGRTYTLMFKENTFEHYTFKLSKHSKYVKLVNNKQDIVVKKRKLKKYFKDGSVHFLATQYE
ncbi:MAG: hypothetical protein RR588_01665 [Solibacillus sp.]